jgi:DNA-binding transcriptional ArsR family regulator
MAQKIGKQLAIKKPVNFSRQNYMMKLFKIMGNSNRIKILRALNEQANKTLNVGQITKACGATQGNISNHLIKMREAGALKARQDGLVMYYTIKEPAILKMLELLD